MVLVKFQSVEADIQLVEDLIVKIPSQVDEYARDLYDGSPFKYKMASDPEISIRPVRPGMIKYSSWGFAVGAALFSLYWLFTGSFVAGKKAIEDKEEIFPAPSLVPFEPALSESVSEPEPTRDSKPEIVPEQKIQEQKTVSKTSHAPANLPIAHVSPADGDVSTSSDEYHEPSDEEVKDRLNKLMRGEL